MIAMIVRRTTSAASVKPASEGFSVPGSRFPVGGVRFAVPSPRLPRRTENCEPRTSSEVAERNIVLGLPLGLALHVGDSGALPGVGTCRGARGLIGLHLLVGR